MADTAVKSPTDAVRFLVEQHERIKSLFAETLEAAGEEREKCFVELRRLLAVHETAEELIIHPRAKREIANGESIVEARLKEEHDAKELLTELETVDIESVEFSQQLSKLRDGVVHHAEQEERQEFSKLESELGDVELELLGRATQLAQKLAPTRPRAGVESQAGNMLAGPFAMMVDRVRDAIVGKG